MTEAASISCESSRVCQVGKALPLLQNKATFSPIQSSLIQSLDELVL